MSLVRKYKEKFIEQRAREEMSLNEFFTGIQRNIAVDERSVLGNDPTVYDKTLKDFCPELYVENPSTEIYEEQYKKYHEYIESLNLLINEANREAEEAIQDYLRVSEHF